MATMNGMGKVLGTVALVATLGTGAVVSSEYADYAGFDGRAETGRTKNSLSTVVAGVAAQQAYGNAQLDLKLKKHLWPDARVIGSTTPNSVDTHVGLAFTSATFHATNGQNGLSGKVDKSEFDWAVQQTSPDTYRIGRFGWKFDAYLRMTAKDGRITGTYERRGPHFDWHIDGTYGANGNARINIHGPMMLGVTLEGKLK